MKILTATFFDDNYGDMLIRTCFVQLLKVALKNLGIDDYTVDAMYLKDPDDEKIVSADVIVIPGGAMFGINYLGVAGYIEHILSLAEQNDIAVIFSSIGFNHMDESDESDERLSDILAHPCIKAVSVRDSLDIFRRYAGDRADSICPVCDPAFWTASVYHRDIADITEQKRLRQAPVVGINVVRGGLFKDNCVDWTLTKEEAYLYALSQLLDSKGIAYRFFTNGQTWDGNTMKHFADKYGIPADKFIYPETAREVVQAIAGFDAVIAIRMHAAIISYALSVPSVNFVWNPKLPYFYETIGYPERAVPPQEWSAEKAADIAGQMLAQKDYRPDPDTLMTLYRFIYDTFRSLCPQAENPEDMYDCDTVSRLLRGMEVPPAEDDLDLRTKLKRASSRYYNLFKSDDKKKGEIKKLTKEIETASKENKKLQAKTESLEDANEDLLKQLYQHKTALEKMQKERDQAQKELDRLNSKFIIRTYRKLRGTYKN